MRYLKYLALLALLIIPVTYSHAQVSIGVQIGPSYGIYNAPPVCDYGFYPDLSFWLRAVRLLRPQLVCGRRVYRRGPLVQLLLHAVRSITGRFTSTAASASTASMIVTISAASMTMTDSAGSVTMTDSVEKGSAAPVMKTASVVFAMATGAKVSGVTIVTAVGRSWPGR